MLFDCVYKYKKSEKCSIRFEFDFSKFALEEYDFKNINFRLLFLFYMRVITYFNIIKYNIIEFILLSLSRYRYRLIIKT